MHLDNKIVVVIAAIIILMGMQLVYLVSYSSPQFEVKPVCIKNSSAENLLSSLQDTYTKTSEGDTSAGTNKLHVLPFGVNLIGYIRGEIGVAEVCKLNSNQEIVRLNITYAVKRE